MHDPGASRDIRELVTRALGAAGAYADSVRELGADSPRTLAEVELGIPLSSAAVGSPEALEQMRRYKEFVRLFADGCGWMDNTTILTAATLMSEHGEQALTPLTVWDLVTFLRAILSYERIYHHEHPGIDDQAINARLGEDVLRPVPLPVQEGVDSGFVGPSRMMWEVWEAGYGWLRRLAERANTQTLDGAQLVAVRDAWSRALADPQLDVEQLVDWRDASLRWQSPSDEFLRQLADATDVTATRLWIDARPGSKRMDERRAEVGLPPGEQRAALLTDLNLRAHINQQLADFFELPYVSGLARVPFRRHLYDRARAVDDRLATLEVIDDSYARLSQKATLRVPVFLALALRQARKPEDLWAAAAQLRGDAGAYRRIRVWLDEALAREDLNEAEQAAAALSTSIDNVLAVAGAAVAAAGGAALTKVATGDVTGVSAGLAAVEAARKRLVDSSVITRLKWRLLRPHLLWMNNIMDEARAITEALPDAARVWQIPEMQQQAFATRFQAMAALHR
jgi:hypothetical protein